MSALPRPQPGPPPLRLVPKEEGSAAVALEADPRKGDTQRRVARASAWTVTSMIALSVLRLGNQMVLSHLCLPEAFGAVALMRTFLTFVEMVSDMGIRGAVAYHPK